MANPILDFGIDPAALSYIGNGLQRPECILAEQDGTLEVMTRSGESKVLADSFGGVQILAVGNTSRLRLLS